MGGVKDNYYLCIHRQDHFEAPEYVIRRHLGSQGIDVEHVMQPEQFEDLLLRCVGAEAHFRSKLREHMPELCAQLPSTGYPTIQRLFRDMRAVNPQPALK